MEGKLDWSTSHWYVIQTHSRQEDRAESNLRAWSVQTFAPKIKERRCNQFTGAVTYLAKPLFPRYVFAKFKLTDLYHKIRFTRGVHSLVSFGNLPTPLDEQIISIIKSRVMADGYVKLGQDLQPGDEVIIKEGPLTSFTGIFEEELRDTDRVRILLRTVSYQAHAVMERTMIERADKAAAIA